VTDGFQEQVAEKFGYVPDVALARQFGIFFPAEKKRIIPGVSEEAVIVTTLPFDGVPLKDGAPKIAFSKTSVTVILIEKSL
jgi:hypothetical protein